MFNAKLIELARVWVSSMSALNASAGSIPVGCGYSDHQQITVLLLFRPFCTYSCTRCSNQRHRSQGAAALLLLPVGTVLQHRGIILRLQKESLPSDLLKEGRLHSKYFFRSQIILIISIP
jgi:hypothetical protein